MAYNPALYMPQSYQTMYQQQQYQPPINGLVSVTGIEGAKAYQLPPNSAMPLFDANSDVLYLKTTDAAGYPTIREFEFKPRAAAVTVQDQTVEDRLSKIEAALAELTGKESREDGKQHIRKQRGVIGDAGDSADEGAR